ncbi:DNA-directed RNA polymerase subunit beta [Salipaludibacillus sp. CF4.18]|uniref:DNA-directed RNA polymerase subunit beta n=1 Tax=Salipaludibacillus sp. CF4.18 TaxID=3373081 RepID=UPI003EE477B0
MSKREENHPKYNEDMMKPFTSSSSDPNQPEEKDSEKSSSQDREQSSSDNQQEDNQVTDDQESIKDTSTEETPFHSTSNSDSEKSPEIPAEDHADDSLVDPSISESDQTADVEFSQEEVVPLTDEKDQGIPKADDQSEVKREGPTEDSDSDSEVDGGKPEPTEDDDDADTIIASEGLGLGAVEETQSESPSDNEKDEETLKQEEKTQEEEDSSAANDGKKRKNKKNKPSGRIRFIPIWFRVILVLFLVIASVIVGAMVGYGIIGPGGNPMDVFEPDTWYHIYDIIFDGTEAERQR